MAAHLPVETAGSLAGNDRNWSNRPIRTSRPTTGIRRLRPRLSEPGRSH